MPEETRHQVKTVVLPSGKTIEVVLFPEHRGVGPAAHPPAEPAQDLRVCIGCGCGMVFPADWVEAGPENWSVVLCCPNCGHERSGVFAQHHVEHFDEQLEEGADALARDYRRLLRSNLAEEIDRFVVAIEADAILPEDF